MLPPGAIPTRLALRALVHRFRPGRAVTAWARYLVHDVPWAQAVAQTLTDRDDLAALWAVLPRNVRIVDLGCGWGRLLPVLRPYAAYLTGVEPDPALRRMADHALPGVPAHEALAERHEIGLAYQVLQHLTDDEVHATLHEWRRWLSWLVLMEKTDPAASRIGEPGVPWARSVGRSVEQYAGWMNPWALVKTLPRSGDARSTWIVFTAGAP